MPSAADVNAPAGLVEPRLAPLMRQPHRPPLHQTGRQAAIETQRLCGLGDQPHVLDEDGERGADVVEGAVDHAPPATLLPLLLALLATLLREVFSVLTESGEVDTVGLDDGATVAIQDPDMAAKIEATIRQNSGLVAERILDEATPTADDLDEGDA